MRSMFLLLKMLHERFPCMEGEGWPGHNVRLQDGVLVVYVFLGVDVDNKGMWQSIDLQDDYDRNAVEVFREIVPLIEEAVREDEKS